MYTAPEGTTLLDAASRFLPVDLLGHAVVTVHYPDGSVDVGPHSLVHPGLEGLHLILSWQDPDLDQAVADILNDWPGSAGSAQWTTSMGQMSIPISSTPSASSNPVTSVTGLTAGNDNYA